MDKKRKAPRLRFPGFTDDWEQRKCSDFIKFVGGATPSKSNKSYWNGDIIWLSSQEINKGGFVDSGTYTITDKALDDGTTKLVKADTPLFISRSGILAHSFPITRPTKDVAINQDIKAMLFDRELYFTDFIVYMMENKADYILKSIVKSGTTVQSVSMPDMEKMEVCLPEIKEQHQIGMFFLKLDNLITLHQRKCDMLVEYKKGMLQKMFPQNGASVPEIRFPGFTGDWEQFKFLDFTWNAGKRNVDELDLEPYAITKEHGFIRQSEAHDDYGYMKDTDRKAYNIVMPKSFAYNPARINVGSIGYYEGVEDVIVSSLYEVFQTADYVDDRFLWHWFKSDEFPKWIERLQEGSVRLYFYYDKLCECQLLLPSIAEQKKISAVFDELNDLIELHQRKLECIKEYKKGLLQQLFV